jgi:hypothetical protein
VLILARHVTKRDRCQQKLPQARPAAGRINVGYQAIAVRCHFCGAQDRDSRRGLDVD